MKERKGSREGRREERRGKERKKERKPLVQLHLFSAYIALSRAHM